MANSILFDIEAKVGIQIMPIRIIRKNLHGELILVDKSRKDEAWIQFDQKLIDWAINQ